MDNVERPIRAKELARWLGVTTEHLAVMRHRGTGPTHIKRGGIVFYLPSDVQAWLDDGRQNNQAA